MQTIEQLIAEHPFFATLDANLLKEIVGCAQNVHFERDAYLSREGDPADTFYLVRHGRVALEISGTGGRRLTIDTVEHGEVVGWSWLVPPYLWFFDTRAVEPTSAVAIDGSCVRGKCDADPRLGYELLRRVVAVMFERMQAARVRLLDLYAVPGERAH